MNGRRTGEPMRTDASELTDETGESRPPGDARDASPVDAALEDFEAFCRRGHQSLLAVAFVLTGSPGSAEELAQDALLAAYQRWDRISSYDDPGAWARRVVANRAISRRRRFAAEWRAMTRLRARPAPPQQLPEPAAELWTAVRSLPTRQAEVIALTYVDDLSLSRV